MKELLLLRHAKSSWADTGQADIDRPLSKRGRKGAAHIADWLTSEGLRPALVLCSSARRTRETLDLLHDALGPQVAIQIEPSLYLAEPASLVARLRRVAADVPSVLLIGHNPGLHELARQFAGSASGASADIRDRLLRKFPTAALLRLRLRIDAWSKLAMTGPAGTLRLIDYVTPGDLDGDN